MAGPYRACWIDAGNDPDYMKLAAAGITWPYFDAREQRLTKTYLEQVMTHGGLEGVGVYVVATWFPTMTAPQVAEWTDTRLKQIGWAGNPPVMFDVEVADVVGYSASLMARWRELRPKRITDLTIEGHKGGLFAGHALERIALSAQCRWIVPQCYNGAMTQVWDDFAMALDLVEAGFGFGKVIPFLDAAHLGEWWTGFAFTQGRLP